jgi:hypothetical protein
MGDKIRSNSVQMTVKDGVATIEQGTALTRLHYFDGKFLRADALTLEQDYHRTLVRLSNLAGGWGVVHGLGLGLSGNLLSVTPGLAVTPAGSTVLLSTAISVEITKLIAAAASAPANPLTPGGTGSSNFSDCSSKDTDSISTTPSTGYYEVTLGPIEGLSGNEEVYGKLCEDACVTDSQNPYWQEGVILRLRLINLNLLSSTAVPPTDLHLRNRVASAYFAAEPWLSNPLLSAAGLASATWCNPATLYNRDEVPIGLLVREGTSISFIDAWSARRENMDSQARSYWQGRMMMRPWNVFIAQILQFQCQLVKAFTPGSAHESDSDRQGIRDLLADSLAELELVKKGLSESSQNILQKLATQLARAQADYPPLPSNRLLINSGFMELPPAGYLPVDPGNQPINKQLKRFFGEGVKLYFCTTRSDYIPHAVEEAQHMDRISLTRGLDNPKDIEEVEIFVPDGQSIDSLGLDSGIEWNVKLPEAPAYPGEMLVRANRDWVMFRRRRKAQCDLKGQEDMPATTVSMQTWHARLQNAEDLQFLIEAIDDNKPDALKDKPIKFEHVDVLHYVDQSQSPTEPMNHIIAHWQAAMPGNRILLGRIWSHHPSQGWLNPARLKNLIDMLVPIMTMTAPAGDKLRILPSAPETIDDKNFDGGMLLVTIGASQKLHRVYLVDRKFQKPEMERIKNPEDVDISAVVESDAEFSTNISFDEKDAPTVTELNLLKEEFHKLKLNRQTPAFAIELVSELGQGEIGAVDERHSIVVEALSLRLQEGEKYHVSKPNFGTGVSGATVVYF